MDTAPPRLRNHCLHRSGGLVWHWRALRYCNTLWQPFRHIVGAWLQDWQPDANQLVIVGPSAGYTLNAGFLAGWREVIALEPDPLARWLLRLRFPRTQWRFADVDLFDETGAAPARAIFPRAAVLFSNVLGQLTAAEPIIAAAFIERLKARMEGVHWASYHDIISTHRPADAMTHEAFAPGASLEATIARCWQGGEIAVVDHHTFGLGCQPARARSCAVWSLTPRQHHLVEWLASA